MRVGALKPLEVSREPIKFMKEHDCKKLLEAAMRHDEHTFKLTRDEAAGLRPVGTTPRHEPIAPFTAFVLLSGMRLGEALRLQWDDVDLAAAPAGSIHIEGKTNKTKTYREVDLAVSPALRSLLVTMQLKSGGKGSVFGLTEGLAEAAAKRLKALHGAPKSFGWQVLRRTCGTYLTNAPGIFAGASAYRSAKQLGHSVQVAERHYVGLVKGIPVEAHDLESAMQIGEQLNAIVERVGVPAERPRLAVVS